jgi:hypothetical protein
MGRTAWTQRESVLTFGQQRQESPRVSRPHWPTGLARAGRKAVDGPSVDEVRTADAARRKRAIGDHRPDTSWGDP